MKNKLGRILSILLCLCLIFEQSAFAQVAAQLDIAGHLNALRSSFVQDKFRPLHLRYMSYDTLSNSFKLLLDKGDLKNPQPTELENVSKDLLKYFFIGIALPNDSFWVNLRPDAEDNIIDGYLAQTDIGKIMLEADLQLKKDTAKATSPETPEGKKYWDKLYKKAGEIFGYDNVTIPTLTRPWIVPDEIIIRESVESAYIYKATLKVMLEQDYLKDSTTYSFKDPRLKALNEYSSQLIRELIIPKLTKEINTSKRYAPLRQVYYSLILAQWFKARYANKDTAYSRLINRGDLTNLSSKESWSKSTYFKQYQKSFKDGEYNLSEPVYTPYGQTIRSYFSGGISGFMRQPQVVQELTRPIGDAANKAVLPAATPAAASPILSEYLLLAVSKADGQVDILTQTSASPIGNQAGGSRRQDSLSYLRELLDTSDDKLLSPLVPYAKIIKILASEYLFGKELLSGAFHNNPNEFFEIIEFINDELINKRGGIDKLKTLTQEIFSENYFLGAKNVFPAQFARLIRALESIYNNYELFKNNFRKLSDYYGIAGIRNAFYCDPREIVEAIISMGDELNFISSLPGIHGLFIITAAKKAGKNIPLPEALEEATFYLEVMDASLFLEESKDLDSAIASLSAGQLISYFAKLVQDPSKYRESLVSSKYRNINLVIYELGIFAVAKLLGLPFDKRTILEAVAYSKIVDHDRALVGALIFSSQGEDVCSKPTLGIGSLSHEIMHNLRDHSYTNEILRHFENPSEIIEFLADIFSYAFFRWIGNAPEYYQDSLSYRKYNEELELFRKTVIRSEHTRPRALLQVFIESHSGPTNIDWIRLLEITIEKPRTTTFPEKDITTERFLNEILTEYDGQGNTPMRRKDNGGDDGGSSAILSDSGMKQKTRNTDFGGIDFRTLPIVTQAISNLSLNASHISLSRLDSINLNQEWLQIQKMVEAGITPSTERIKEHIQLSCLKGELNDMQKVISCIADILRDEEERCASTEPTLKDILVVLESGRSTQELKAVFTAQP